MNTTLEVNQYWSLCSRQQRHQTLVLFLLQHCILKPVQQLAQLMDNAGEQCSAPACQALQTGLIGAREACQRKLLLQLTWDSGADSWRLKFWFINFPFTTNIFFPPPKGPSRLENWWPLALLITLSWSKKMQKGFAFSLNFQVCSMREQKHTLSKTVTNWHTYSCGHFCSLIYFSSL